MAQQVNAQTLQRYTVAVQKLLYDAKRAKPLLGMLNTRMGAVQAVNVVLDGVTHYKPVPPEILPILGLNIYLLLVDLEQRVSGRKVDTAALKATINAVLSSVAKRRATKPGAAQPPPPAQPERQPGLIGQAALQGAPA